MKEKEEVPSGRAKEAKIEALEMTVEEPTENEFQEQLIEEFCKSQQIFGRNWCTLENALKQNYGEAIGQISRTYNLMP